jgi:hypothetical protein
MRSFQYLFSLKSIIYAFLSSAMLRENHAVFLGKKYRFLRGGGINIRFRPKYRPLLGHLPRFFKYSLQNEYFEANICQYEKM